MRNRLTWSWQSEKWPEFTFDASDLMTLEARFLRSAGEAIGVLRHASEEDRLELAAELVIREAYKTTEIEGELLDRESLQSSIRRNFGLATDHRHVSPAELGISEMLLDLYRHFSGPLTHETLWCWHEMVCKGRGDLNDLGRYRTDPEPMQVVSGPLHAPKVHYEAPPSERVHSEMERFISWFNRTAPDSEAPLAPLARASLAHLYFELIHPFEDGNGRIGRAIAEKALSQALEQPTLMALSQEIQEHRRDYYEALARNNRSPDVTDWMRYFANTILAAQANSRRLIDFLLAKARFYGRHAGQMNGRQLKVVDRMFREGFKGFTGGLSAKNYRSITDCPPATATRDLADMVEKGVLTKTGKLKGTRYWLNLPEQGGRS
ncbi:Fic family protein [Pacificispira sp.]|uniref:Fic family protein n=1 Tax=Pacificispira sp. TaxID=2888761 RepID=UPI003B5160C7